jgi:hypothetical protein
MEFGDFPFFVGFTNKPFVCSSAGIAVGIGDIIDETFVCDDVLRELEVGNFIGTFGVTKRRSPTNARMDRGMV